MSTESPRCPHCQESISRIHRHLWMRLLPGSRLYRCTRCRRQYFRFIAWFRQR